MRRVVSLVPFLALAADAWATTGLVWQWPAEGRRFVLAARVDLPTVIAIEAEKNIEVRTSQFQIDLITTCTPTDPPPKSGARLACVLNDVAVRTSELAAVEDDHVVAVLQELDQRLTGAVVQVATDGEGHVRSVDLEGVSKDNERLARIHENARQMILRAFALLDFELPKGGDDKGKGVWRQNNSLVTAFPSGMGTMGGVSLDNAIASTDGTVVTIASRGKGVVQSGETVSVNGVERPKYTWDVVMEGDAKFDVASGRLIERGVHVVGTPTASSPDTMGLPYTQVSRLVALGAGETPVLPDSGVLVE